MAKQMAAAYVALAAEREEALKKAATVTNEALTNAMQALRAEVSALLATLPNAPLSAREVGTYSSQAMKLVNKMETALLRRTSGYTKIEIDPQDAS